MMRWFVGDGQTIRVWQDHWLPNGSLRDYIEGPLPYQEEDQRINSLWDNQTWSFDPINLPLPPSPPKIQELIQGILVTRVATLEDSFLWPHNKGVCSVKSATTFLFQRQLVSWDKACWNWIWASPCPKKIQIFLWKALCDRLPTKTFLVFGRPSVDLRCPRCQYPETTIHIL